MCVPVEPTSRIADVAEPHPLRTPTYAIYGAMLGGGYMPERSCTVPQDDPDPRRATPL